jgi:N-acetylmuramoyl-L-alanine amidase
MRRSGVASHTRKFAAVAIVMFAIRGIAAASTADAVLSGASLARFGKVVELRFTLRGARVRPELSAHGSQLWIDLARTRIAMPPRPLDGRISSPVDSVRVMRSDAGDARLVIEVNQHCDYAMARSAHALLIRFAPYGSTPNLAAPLLTGRNQTRHPAAYAPPPRYQASSPPQAEPPPATELAALHPPRPPLSMPAPPLENRGSESRPIVMIDPGHGGNDPGTEAGAPFIEKTIALEISIRLAHALAKRGVDARLTRRSDYFIPLPERTQMANRAGADLFVSIHLNSSPDPETAGIESYYLNNTTDRATIRLARIENAAGGGRYGASSAVDLNYILSDLRQNNKAAESATLARMIEAQTVATLNSNLGVRLNELGAKQGPFYVLVGARMPAVLVECGFLSNRVEAANLASAPYQQAMADAIADAVVHYFNSDAAVGNL